MLEKSKENKAVKTRKSKSVFSTILKWTLILLLLILILIILLQFSFVQNKVADFATKRLAKQYNTEIKVDSVSFSISKGAQLNGFYLEDMEHDTLIYAEKLNVSLQSSLFSLFNNNLDLSAITLENSVVKLKTQMEEGETNFDQVFESEQKEQGKPAKSPLKLALDKITLINNRVEIKDKETKAETSISLKRGFIDIDHFDLSQNNLALETFSLESPRVTVLNAGNQKVNETKTEENVTSSEESKINKEDIQVSTAQKSNWTLTIDDFKLSDAIVNVSTKGKNKAKRRFDPKSFEIQNMNAQVTDLKVYSDSLLFVRVNEFSANIDNQIQLNKLTSAEIELNSSGLKISDFQLETDKTLIKQNVKLNFANEIPKSLAEVWEMNSNIDIKSSKISEKELLYFLPQLENVALFKNQEIGFVLLEGKISGKTKNIRAQDIAIRLGSNSYFKGDIATRNLNQAERQLINLSIDELSSTVSELRKIIPGFKPPDNFNKLGTINFKGRIDGFFKDFVCFGEINTDLGVANLDLSLDVKPGINDAKYSGNLNLENFDIRRWSDNDDFGLVSLSVKIEEGQGLIREKARAKLNGSVDHFQFKGYDYRNAQLTGVLDDKEFNGTFNIRDENLDFDFEGIFEFDQEIPQYAFSADINKLDLTSLNLSKDDIAFSGKVNMDMSGKRLESAIGTIQVDSFKIIKDGMVYQLDSVLLESKERKDGMSFHLESNVADFDIAGKFDLRQLPKIFVQILKKNYPYHTRDIKVDYLNEKLSVHNFDFALDIKDSENFLELAGVHKLNLVDTKIKGKVDDSKDLFDIDIETPLFSFQKIKLIDFRANLKNLAKNGQVDLMVDTFVYDKNAFEALEVSLAALGDELVFYVQSESNTSTKDALGLKGKLIPHKRGYEVNIADNKLTMLGEQWKFSTDNQIVIGTKYIGLKNFNITDGKRQISINDIENKGLDIKLLNFDLDLINPIVDYDKMFFSGQSVVKARIENVFEKPKINADLKVEDFRINEDPWGSLNIIAIQETDSRIDLNFLVQKEEQKFAVAGYYDIDKKYLESFVKVDKYPISIFEYIIPDGISNTSGNVDIEARIFGGFDDLQLTGDAYVNQGQVRIDYLGATYKMDKQPLTLNQDYIDLEGAIIIDENNNTAVMSGGLHHAFFKDFEVEANISSDNFIALNTTKEDNPLYYGLGVGEMELIIRGPFSSPNFEVEAKTGPGTNLVFPIANTVSDYDESFVRFISSSTDTVKTSNNEEENAVLIEGIDFEMNLEITEDANMELVFDESVGEVLEGNGRGNVQVYIKRNGDFDVFGEYSIVEGKYLFAAWDLVAKPFRIEEGSTLRWTGDPFDADLDVRANYTGIRSPLNVFLDEYLAAVPLSVQQEADNRTVVILKLLLGGTLYNTEVNFDLEFEDIAPQLRPYVNTKMQLLRSTENGINNQAAGLLAFRSFLPTNNPYSGISGGNIVATGANTVREFITSQVGLVVENYLEGRLSSDSFIKDIDFDVGLNENSSLFGENNANANLLPDELNLNLRNHLRNDLVISVGGNYVWENTIGAGDYLIGDFQIEWFITKDRRLKFKVYSKLDYDEVRASRKVKYGSGINYRREFGDLAKYKKETKKSERNGK